VTDLAEVLGSRGARLGFKIAGVVVVVAVLVLAVWLWMRTEDARGQAALGDGDEALDERPQLLRLRHRRLDLLVTQQRDGLVPQQREAMLGDAAQFAMTYVVSHSRFLVFGLRSTVSGH